jgi:hypothetical protein
MMAKRFISGVVLAAGFVICNVDASGSVPDAAMARSSNSEPRPPSQHPNGGANWCCDPAEDLRCRIPPLPFTPWGASCWCPGPSGGYGTACYGPPQMWTHNAVLLRPSRLGRAW